MTVAAGIRSNTGAGQARIALRPLLLGTRMRGLQAVTIELSLLTVDAVDSAFIKQSAYIQMQFQS